MSTNKKQGFVQVSPVNPEQGRTLIVNARSQLKQISDESSSMELQMDKRMNVLSYSLIQIMLFWNTSKNYTNLRSLFCLHNGKRSAQHSSKPVEI